MEFIMKVATLTAALSTIVLAGNLANIWHNLREMESEGLAITQHVVTAAINRRPYLRVWAIMLILSLAVVVSEVL